jgi:hypothetical protein
MATNSRPSDLVKPDAADRNSAIDPALLGACGQACIGLGQAIQGLARATNQQNIKELSQQLHFISRNLSWSLRCAAKAAHPDTSDPGGGD